LVACLLGQDAAAAAALAVLYDRYATAVYRVGRRLLRDDGAAEDVLQETFWRLWAHAGRYAPGRGRFSTWLLRIATNLATDAHRRAARRPQAPSGPTAWPIEASRSVPVPEDVEDPAPSVPDQVWQAELRGVLAAGLATLPPAQRHVVELVYVSGFTHAESAVRLGTPCSTVKTRLALGLRKLAAHLKAHGVTQSDGRR
jgi:RNA polymerase sigma-70 factor (ECF subfamily)